MRTASPLIALAVLGGLGLWLAPAQCQELDPEVARQALVEELAREGISDPRVLHALATVPRHELVPADERGQAYENHPLPIGYGQTISQPYIVAYMTEQLRLEPGDRVLEIGTGSGYQAAVLALLCAEVYSVEIVPELGERAARDLARLGYANVHVRVGDGYQGWPEAAPFDAIILTAAPDHVPQPLLDQLAVGARLVLPVGDQDQELRVLERTVEGIVQRRDLPVRFVPMTGEAETR